METIQSRKVPGMHDTSDLAMYSLCMYCTYWSGSRDIPPFNMAQVRRANLIITKQGAPPLALQPDIIFLAPTEIPLCPKAPAHPTSL